MLKTTLFGQIINLFDKISFTNIDDKYKNYKHNKGINSWTHLIAMVFLQFPQSTSIREISNGLRSATGNLNHFGSALASSKYKVYSFEGQ